MVERTAEGRIRTTEWEDIQYKHGNKVGQYRDDEMGILAQKIADAHPNIQLKAYNPDEEKLEEKLTRNTEESLQEEEDELLEFRNKRLAELKKSMAEQNSGGKLKKISGSDYIAEVTEGSEDRWVVGLLESSENQDCAILARLFAMVSMKYSEVKFVEIPAAEALPNFPIKQLPCVVIYYQKQPVSQLTGLESWGGKKASVESVEKTLARHQVIALEKDEEEEAEIQTRKYMKHY